MNHIRPQHVMLAAVLIMLVLLVFRFRRIRIVGVAAIATTLVVSSWSTAHKLFPGTQNNLYGADLGNVIPSEEIKEPQNIAYDNAYFSIESRFAFQWLLNDAHFVLFNSQHGDRPTTRYVISSVDWPQAKAQNAKLFWSERYGKIGLWEIPSNPIQALK